MSTGKLREVIAHREGGRTRKASAGPKIPATLQAALKYHQAGQLSQAEVIYRRVLQAEPNNPDALHLLGLIAHQARAHESAAELIAKAIRENPSNPAYHSDIGSVFGALQRVDEAIVCCQKALSIDPDYANAHNNLGVMLQSQGKLQAATDCYKRALSIKPSFADAHFNLGNVFREQGKLEEAIACFQKALLHNPRHTKACNYLGLALRDQGKRHEAIAFYKKALSFQPDNAQLHHSLIYAMVQSAEDEGAAVFAECRRFAEQFEKGVVRLPHRNDSDPERRIKVGYVSGDFRRHSVAYFIEPVLANHDHRAVEVFCYSNHHQTDDVTRRLMTYPDHWRPIVDLSDDKVAALIQQDGIDILVDLSGHTEHNRLLVFARKPAPVQVTWIGLPVTTGLSAMDYRLTNNHIDPIGTTEQYHTETLFRLPLSACYQPEAELPPVNELPALANGYVTFSSFNNPQKISAAAVAVWSRILALLPGSRLLMICPASLRAQASREFMAGGIGPERLVFVDRLPVRDYLALHHRVDLALDTFPYSGGTTTRNSLWMGVPVVTLVGKAAVSRTGLRKMSEVGLEAFVAESEEDYVRIALRWARDVEGLAQVRRELRQRMQEAPSGNAAAYTREVEAAYRQMWQNWCAGQAASTGCEGNPA